MSQRAFRPAVEGQTEVWGIAGQSVPYVTKCKCFSVELFQCQMVRVEVSQCLNGGWTNDHSTVILVLYIHYKQLDIMRFLRYSTYSKTFNVR
jgi:hypothetical protein